MKIDVALVGRLIRAQFPQWSTLAIRPVDPSGWDNRTFRLGDKFSVRLPSAKRYSTQVDKEHRWLPILSRSLPLVVPIPVAKGSPNEEYPWHWSIYRWIDGETAAMNRISDLNEFATTLAQFLVALRLIDASDGPLAGTHNFFRGGSLATYNREVRNAIATLHGSIDSDAVEQIWETALGSRWENTPVWVHGDVHATNLLVCDGRLKAVIDFGCLGVGDPACDATIAWTLFSGHSREAFRAAMSLDGATWARSRGWALWKALITFAEHIENLPMATVARQTIDDLVVEHHNVA